MTNTKKISRLITEIKQHGCCGYAADRLDRILTLLPLLLLSDGKDKEFRRTKAGVKICPFFGWTSENIEGLGHQEDDVSLTICNHEQNEHRHEGNCQKEWCPLLKQQPETSAFTKECREIINATEEENNNRFGRIGYRDALEERLEKTCDILDGKVEMLRKIEDWAVVDFNESLLKFIKELKAEK